MEASQVEEQEPVEESNPFGGFDPAIRTDVEGLIHLGSLHDEFDLWGHNFTLKTLRAGEEIAAAAAVQHLRGTLKEAEAFASAQVGLALSMIDGDTEFCPQTGPSLEDFARARYNYVVKRWYWPMIEQLFTRYVALQNRQIEALRAVQDLSPRSRTTSTPFADFLTDPGTFPDEIDLATPPPM